jgi:uncharacterized protein YbjT (DUF2867 family)
MPSAGHTSAQLKLMPDKNKNKLILVTGATGHQGGAVLRHLRERGFPVRALTRDPDQPKSRALAGKGVEVVRGNLDDQASLTRALDGVYGVFSVQNWHEGGLEAEIRQGTNLADAARRSRISHFVFTSVASADRHTGVPHFESKFRVEEYLRGTGTHYTIVRPVFFMENWLGMRQMIESGSISLPLAPEARLQMVAVDDIGVVVATAFEHPGKWQGRTFELAGDELSMTAVAQVFTRVAGKEVKYVQKPWDEFEKGAGKESTIMFHWFQDTGYNVDISAVRQELSNITTFDRWINTSWHTATQTAG